VPENYWANATSVTNRRLVTEKGLFAERQAFFIAQNLLLGLIAKLCRYWRVIRRLLKLTLTLIDLAAGATLLHFV
jgi:hypothetical protein